MRVEGNREREKSESTGRGGGGGGKGGEGRRGGERRRQGECGEKRAGEKDGEIRTRRGVWRRVVRGKEGQWWGRRGCGKNYKKEGMKICQNRRRRRRRRRRRKRK